MALPSVGQTPHRPQVNLSDLHPRMAKAEVKKTDLTMRAVLGHVIQRARFASGWSLKEFAREMGDRDPALMGRWESGEDRPLFDVMLAHEVFRPHLVIELAQMAGCKVTTVIEVEQRRRA